MSVDELKLIIATELGISATEIANSLMYKIYNDELYLHHLSMYKEDKVFLKILLDEPENRISDNKLPSDTELVIRLSKSLTKWTKTGFSTTSEEEYKRRIDICYQCPQLRFPPKQISSPAYGKLNMICQLCGCLADKKARFPDETCPERRW